MADKSDVVRKVRIAANAAHATPPRVSKDQLDQFLSARSVAELVDAAAENVTDKAKGSLVTELRKGTREGDLAAHALANSTDVVVRETLGEHRGGTLRAKLVDVFALADGEEQNVAATLLGIIPDGESAITELLGVENAAPKGGKKK